MPDAGISSSKATHVHKAFGIQTMDKAGATTQLQISRVSRSHLNITSRHYTHNLPIQAMLANAGFPIHSSIVYYERDIDVPLALQRTFFPWLDDLFSDLKTTTYKAAMT